MLQTGSQTDVRVLCARRAGWDVLLREGGKKKSLVKLRAELRQSLLSATRRHLDAGATVMEIAASPRGKPGVARSDDPHPAVILHERLGKWRDDLATQPPRKKLRELAASMGVSRERGDTDEVLYKRLRATITKAAADEPDALDPASRGQAHESRAAQASAAKRKGGADVHSTLPKGSKTTDKMLKEYLQGTELTARLADRQDVLEMRLKSTGLGPEKAAEYRFLRQVGGEFCRAHTLEKLRAFAMKCGFMPRLHGERIDDMRERLFKAWQEAVDSGLPVRDGHLLCVREMHARRVRMPAHAPAALLRAADFLAAVKTVAIYKAELPLQALPAWSKRAGVVFQPQKPAWCAAAGLQNSKQPQQYMQADAIHYDLTCLWLREVDAWSGGGSHPADAATAQCRPYGDFFAACRCPKRRLLEPFPAFESHQSHSRRFVPHQCLRQLALIEMVDSEYIDLPLDDAALLCAIQDTRANEEHHCQVLSEVHEAAVRRLVEYSCKTDRVCANARFLNLVEPVGADGVGKLRPCQTEASAQTAVRRMIDTLVRAFDKTSVDMTVFKPNHFATLCVYYSMFLCKGNRRPQNGLARWCFAIKTYTPGDKIEPEEIRQEHLASQCLPAHYDPSGVLQLAGLNESGQAIAAAPVTCELCHVGLAGFDALRRHCAPKHCGLAEYRKRTFFKARAAGLCPLLPWVKRSMVQSFQFFRLHSVPSSFNDWTTKATQQAELRREEACAVCAVKDWLENRYPV